MTPLSTFHQSMFVMFDGPAMSVVIQSVLSLSLSRCTPSFVSDSGDCTSYTVPICNGPRCKVFGRILSFQLRGHKQASWSSLFFVVTAEPCGTALTTDVVCSVGSLHWVHWQFDMPGGECLHRNR